MRLRVLGRGSSGSETSRKSRRRFALPIRAALIGLLVYCLGDLGGLGSEAIARDQASLGDLMIPASRVPDWHALDHLPLDTSGWTHTAAPCNDGDPTQLQNLVNTAAANTVVVLPANCKYVFAASFTIARSDIVVRGASRTTSILEFTDLDRDMVLVYIPAFPANEPFGSPRDWTAGFTTGTTVIDVSSTADLAVGIWVRLTADAEPDWHQQAENRYAAKLSCVGTAGGPHCAALTANQVMLDRPLPAPYDQGGQILEAATGSYLQHVGIENLRFQHVDPSRIEKYHSFVEFEDCHECWITDSVFADGGNSHISTKDTLRTVFRGNDFGSNQCTDEGATCSWNKGAIYLNQGNADIVIENNSLRESPSGPLGQGGAGAVIAYNYMTSSDAVECERHVFLHGQGVTATLAEGNDVDCMMQWDSYRDGQGYNNMFYRNRLRGVGNQISGYQRGRLGGEDTGSFIHRFITVIANHANEFMGGPQITGRAVDESTDAIHRHEDTWVSYNTARSTIVMEDSGQQVRTTAHENYVSASPHSSWSGFNFPASLYRTQAPDWWCKESGPFPNIGAPSDTAGEYSRLPAQIRLEGGTCTSENGGLPPITPDP